MNFSMHMLYITARYNFRVDRETPRDCAKRERKRERATAIFYVQNIDCQNWSNL